MFESALTVEFDEVELQGLEGRATRPLLLSIARLASLAVHVQHKSHGGNAACDKDDDEGSKSPSPAGAVVEDFNELGSSEGRGNPRGTIDTEDDHTVLERCDVGAHDIDNVQEANVTSPVENVTTDVGLNVRAYSLDDHAENANQEHQAKAFDATPDIDGLRHSQWDATTKGSRNDGSNGEQAMGRESRCDIWIQARVDVVLQHVDEVNQIQPVCVRRRCKHSD